MDRQHPVDFRPLDQPPGADVRRPPRKGYGGLDTAPLLPRRDRGVHPATIVMASLAERREQDMGQPIAGKTQAHPPFPEPQTALYGAVVLGGTVVLAGRV